uniref:P-type ATPase n=1 Tax=Aliiroseovarius crassostreae TaxID=154981 RepID=UPI0035CD2CE5
MLQLWSRQPPMLDTLQKLPLLTPRRIAQRAKGHTGAAIQKLLSLQARKAQGAKLPIQGLVDRITLWFVPAVMTVALLTALVWLLVGPDPALTFALVAGVSVLIIACPCAMGRVTPTLILVGTGCAAEMGVLFRKGDAL